MVVEGPGCSHYNDRLETHVDLDQGGRGADEGMWSNCNENMGLAEGLEMSEVTEREHRMALGFRFYSQAKSLTAAFIFYPLSST